MRNNRGRPRLYENDAARQRAHYWRKKKAEQLAARKRRDEYATPDDLFKALNAEFNFDLDACASVENFKCNRFYTLEAREDGLTLPWSPGPVWVNPPYSQIGKWVKKASDEAQNGVTSVMLIPNSTGARYWHKHIQNKSNVEVRFLAGRVKFIGNTARGPAPFDSAIVIFRGRP